MFKVGDKVRVIATQERLDYISAYNLKTQQEYEIVEFIDDCDGNEKWFKLGYGLNSWCQQEDIELSRNTLKVELESKYAVGDKLKNNEYGDLYEVSEIKYDDGFHYRLSKNDIWYGGWYREWSLDNSCTLYTEPEVLEITMEDLEEKFGTKVKIVKGDK